MRTLRLIVTNTFACAAIPLTIAWLAERMDKRWFTSAAPFFRTHTWEVALYRSLGIRRWKGALPNGGAWIGGRFSKARLAQRDSPYLRRFAAETYRGEVAHWAMIAATPVVLLWNPDGTWPVFAVYALAVNLPCILVQRYNRAGCLRILEGRESSVR